MVDERREFVESVVIPNHEVTAEFTAAKIREDIQRQMK
jgi:hypothetical protein